MAELLREELFKRADEALADESASGSEPAPEDFLTERTVQIGDYRYPEPTCYAYVLLERIARGGLPYELTPTETGLYLLWVVLHQDRPAELAALTQRPLPEAELAAFARRHPPTELYRFTREYLPRALEVVRKKAGAEPLDNPATRRA
jgi:hypothetical protein